MPPKRVVFKQTSEAIDCLEDVMALVYGAQLSVDEARALCKKLKWQIDESAKLSASESTIAKLSTRVLQQIADILNGVQVEKVGTILEDAMRMVQKAQLIVDEARALCKKLQDQIDKATKLLSSKSFDGTFDESTIAYLSTRGSKQIADILNGVRVEKVSK